MNENENIETQPTTGGTDEQVQTDRGQRKTRVGTVVSDKMNKTVVVVVERRYAHPLYGKQVTRTKKYHAHDENNEYRIGDVVRIMETRPLSKLKRWRVAELIERAK
ncbi:30S ribosomal protein S17 [soil metagenome]|jgi:small subunit ribosomal protein S17